MEVINYTDRSVAVFGNTKPYSEPLKQAGGRFNPSLKYGNDEETRRPGWIFSKTKENDVRQLVDSLNSQPQPVATSSTSTSSNSTSSKTSQYKSVDSVDKKTFMALVTRVERLEQELKLLQQGAGIKNTSTKNESVVFDDEEDDEEQGSDEEVVVTKPVRLLRK
jgi:hypothetical protein